MGGLSEHMVFLLHDHHRTLRYRNHAVSAWERNDISTYIMRTKMLDICQKNGSPQYLGLRLIYKAHFEAILVAKALEFRVSETKNG